MPPGGLLVEPEKDAVTVDGRPVEPPRQRRYLVLNKPPGFLVTASDEAGRRTVYDLLGEAAGPARLFSVGRLDVATRGLLILTDDGDLAHVLTHPRRGVPKEYLALVSGVPGERALRHLREGVALEDGLTAPAEAEVVRVLPGGRAEVRIVLHEGRKRQVRRMMEAVGHPVKDLRRTAVGPLRLGRLKEGAWRRLRPAEIERLRRAARGEGA